MNIEKLSIGSDVPNAVNVIIEIPAHASPVKYEVDKNSGAVMVDRFMSAPMFYPANYGFVPHTLSDDGDPIDVLVVTPVPLIHGCVISARPVGILKMTDEAGEDAKILAVPTDKLCPTYKNVQSYTELPPLLIAQIWQFFERYKEFEPNKWVKIEGWKDADVAKQEILDSIARYNT